MSTCSKCAHFKEDPYKGACADCIDFSRFEKGSPISSYNYVEHVLRTDSPITPELLERLQDPQTVRLLHAAMGLSTEAAELLDMLKKHIFYGRPLDLVNAAEEVGDNQWYAGLAIDVLRTTMDELLTMNINKLRLRYPEKFRESDAINRDVDKERELLENHRLNPHYLPFDPSK